MYIAVLFIHGHQHITPEGHSLWGTSWVIPFWRINSTACLNIICFCPGELQFLSLQEYFLSPFNTSLTGQMLIFGLPCRGWLTFYPFPLPHPKIWEQRLLLDPVRFLEVGLYQIGSIKTLFKELKFGMVVNWSKLNCDHYFFLNSKNGVPFLSLEICL